MIANTPPPFGCLSVSVVIPMFNAEKYIADCLESLLAQTFTNFEVIIVDDCSTDSSCAIVESYIERFGGRLTLSHMEKNSGGGALPRNRGLSFSCGEYIFFMDADDFFTSTALEELYTLAKDFDADVVYCEKYFVAEANGKKIGVHSYQSGGFVDRPVLEPESLEERVQALLKTRYWLTPWLKLVRRRLLIEHEIFFPRCTVAEDTIWTYGLVFYAKKILRVPNVVYCWRQSEGSVMRSQKTPQQTMNFWLESLLCGPKALDKFMSKPEFFRQNPQYRYALVESYIKAKFHHVLGESFKLKPFEIYAAIKDEFDDKLGEYDVLVSALCTALNTQQKISAVERQNFQQFAAKAQEQVNKFNQFAQAAQKRIAELEAEVKRLKS